MADQPAAEQNLAVQATIAKSATQAARQAWDLFDPSRIKATLQPYSAAVHAVTTHYGRASSVASQHYYRQARSAAGVPGRPKMTVAPAPPARQVADMTGYATSDLYGLVTPESIAKAQAAIDAGVERLVLDQGRGSLIEAVKADPKARGWARVTEPNACAFCTMLALRSGAGLLYRKESTADFPAHDNCRCHVVPVFGPYEPPARLRAAQAVWAASTKGLGGKDALAAFRAALTH